MALNLMEFVLSVDNENMADDPNSVDSVEATFAVQLGACIKFTETSNVDQFSHVVNLRFIFAAISTPQLPDELRHSFQKSLTKFFSLKNGARLLFAPEVSDTTYNLCILFLTHMFVIFHRPVNLNIFNMLNGAIFSNLLYSHFLYCAHLLLTVFQLISSWRHLF